jgi:hypothetical protein
MFFAMMWGLLAPPVHGATSAIHNRGVKSVTEGPFGRLWLPLKQLQLWL